MLRSAGDLWAYPKQVELSQADAPMIDLRPGLSAARAAGAGWLVTTDFGATPEGSPELAALFSELGRQAELAAVFAPSGGGWPTLRVYRLPP
jgi:hypothetical protein